MKRFLTSCVLGAVLVCALTGAAGAHCRRETVSRCSSSVCTVNGVCDGTCTGTGSCRNFDGCNYTQQHVRHGHGRHH